CDRNEACFWLFPSKTTRSPGLISFSNASTIESVGITMPSVNPFKPSILSFLAFHRFVHFVASVTVFNIVHLFLMIDDINTVVISVFQNRKFLGIWERFTC